MTEYVYVLTNPAFPDFVKIGKTNRDIIKRVKELNRQTGVPSPFEVHCCYEFPKGRSAIVEKGIHKGLDNCREISKKEFFKINPDDADALLKSYSDGKRMSLKDKDTISTKEEQTSLDRQRAKRERFTFSMLGIGVGEIITLDKDPNKTAKVVGDREVEYNGEKSALSPLTAKLIRKTACRGSDHWSYQDENLTNRRLRMEEGRDAPKMKD